MRDRGSEILPQNFRGLLYCMGDSRGDSDGGMHGARLSSRFWDCLSESSPKDVDVESPTSSAGHQDPRNTGVGCQRRELIMISEV